MRPLLLVVCLLISGLVAADAQPDAARARLNYMLHCQGCHLSDGQGAPGVVPRMNDYVGNFLRVPGGREFLVRVPGSANAAIDDAALAELLNWMLLTMSPNELTPGWRRYTAAEVGDLRAAPLREVEVVRAELVRSIERSRASE